MENLSTKHFKISLTNYKDKSYSEKGTSWFLNWKFKLIITFI